MLSNEQAREIAELDRNKDIYIKMVTNAQSRKKLEGYYKEFTPLFRKYITSLYDNIDARLSYDSALRTHKIDPYIAGGLADGIGGLGAGLYAANKSAERNKRISEERLKTNDEVFRTGMNLSCDEVNLITCVKNINSILNRYKKIVEYRNNVRNNDRIKAQQKQQEKERNEAKTTGIAVAITTVIVALIIFLSFI